MTNNEYLGEHLDNGIAVEDITEEPGFLFGARYFRNE